MGGRRFGPTNPGSPGFTLVEIAVVIVVLSLLLAMIAGIATAMLGQQRREVTRQRLAGIETAIALFVSQNQRLPCPANGTLAGTDANAGVAQFTAGPPITCSVGGVANSQQHGVVPWRALGISEQDATDGWGNRLTYRVSPDFVALAAMNMTYCDPGGLKATPEPLSTTSGYCDSNCSSGTFPGTCTKPSAVTATRGLQVQNLGGTAIMNPNADPSTGAAYVVISHGENGAGSYSNQGVLQAATGTESGTDEARNAANLVYTAGTTYYIDDFAVYLAGTGHFDDFVLRPSILTVAVKAQLGPRAH
jgi:prepilin-type N-terminal cleavage/methylation domain-containing protein